MKTIAIAIKILALLLILQPLTAQDLRTIVIEENELQMEWERYKVMQGLDESGLTGEEIALYQASVKEGLMIRKVILQLARSKDLVPTDLEVEQIYESIRSSVSTQDEWKNLLEAQFYTEESFRQYLRESEAMERYLDQEVRGSLYVTDQEVRQYYDSHPGEFVENGNKISFEEVEESLTAFIMAQKSRKAVSDFMDRIRSAVVSAE